MRRIVRGKASNHVRRPATGIVLPDACPSNFLRDARNEALRAGNMALATTIKQAQSLRKRGLNANAEGLLQTIGIVFTKTGKESSMGSTSLTLASRFPVEARLVNRSYRVTHTADNLATAI
jgi:hypothetical protein